MAQFQVLNDPIEFKFIHENCHCLDCLVMVKLWFWHCVLMFCMREQGESLLFSPSTRASRSSGKPRLWATKHLAQAGVARLSEKS